MTIYKEKCETLKDKRNVKQKKKKKPTILNNLIKVVDKKFRKLTNYII